MNSSDLFTADGHLALMAPESYHGDRLTRAEREAVEAHAAGCRDCRRKLVRAMPVEAAARLLETGFRAEAAVFTPHLTSEEREAYVEGVLTGNARVAAQQHLDGCPRCQRDCEELSQFRQILDSTDPADLEPQDQPDEGRSPESRQPPVHAPPGRPWWRRLFPEPRPVWAPAMAAAALVALFGVFRLGGLQSDRQHALAVARLRQEVEQQRQIAQAMRENRATGAASEAQLKQQLAAERLARLTKEQEARKVEQQLKLVTAQAQLARSQAEQAARHRQADARDRRAAAATLLARLENLPSPALLQGLMPPSTGSGRTRGGSTGSGSPAPAVIRLRAGVRTVVLRDRAILAWEAVPKKGVRYHLTAVDVATEALAVDSVTPDTQYRIAPERLKPGHTYEWQVAVEGGKEASRIARFRVMDDATREQLQRLRQTEGEGPLSLGILYARSGLLDEARREFAAAKRQPEGVSPPP